MKISAKLSFARFCSASLLSVGVSIAVQYFLVPDIYRMRWEIDVVAVRSVGCIFGACVAGLIWPNARGAIIALLIFAHLVLDVWCVRSFHVLQPLDESLDESAMGWMVTPLSSKVWWVSIFAAAGVFGSLIGHTLGVALQKKSINGWTRNSSKVRESQHGLALSLPCPTDLNFK